MADDTAPPPPISTPYLVTQPDGSSATYYLHTDRAPTIGEVADYANAQGQTFAGFPEGAAAPPRPEAEAPSPQLSAAPPEQPPTLGQQAWNVISPRRSLFSEWPSVAGAIPGAMYGASLLSPLGPIGTAVGGVGGAVVGGMTGEAAQYGAERVIGSQPAEPGTFGQRVIGAGLRQGFTEGVGAPFRAAPEAAYGVVKPVAEAAEELSPILTGTAERAVEGRGAAAQLPARAQNRLPDWWTENVAGKTPGEALQAWNTLTTDEQALIAGEHLPAVQTIMRTFQQGSQPWQALKQVGPFGYGGLPTAGWAYYGGHPWAAAGSLTPAVTDVLAPAAMARALQSPARGVPFLAGLPAAARVAGPIWGVTTRLGAQPIVHEQWPPATRLLSSGG